MGDSKMKFRPIIVALILLTAVSAVWAQSQTDKNNGQRFAGTFSYSFMFGGSSLTLNADGTFQEQSGSCTFSTRQSGTYAFTDGQLRFKITKYTGDHNDGKDIDLLDAKERREFFQEPADAKDEPLRTEFVLNPIAWGDRLYLIYENDLSDFIDAINFGIEPRGADIQRNYYGTFLLREGDDEKKTDGVPALPSNYKERLLREPITATIVSIEIVGKQKVATIDRGRLAGVVIGTKFIVKDEMPAIWSDEGVVVSVDETSAKIKVTERVVGEELTTKPTRKDPFQ